MGTSDSRYIAVQLTNEQWWRGYNLGTARQNESLRMGLRDAHGFNGVNGLQRHIEGACGEIAAAVVLGLPFEDTINTFKLPDLPFKIQVRTRSKPYYELIVRMDDPDDEIFVCVTGTAPNFAVRGWMYGGDAKRPEWIRTHGGREPAWFVPHACLRTVAELMPYLHPFRRPA